MVPEGGKCLSERHILSELKPVSDLKRYYDEKDKYNNYSTGHLTAGIL